MSNSNVREGGAGEAERGSKEKQPTGTRDGNPTCDDGQKRGIEVVSNKTPRRARICDGEDSQTRRDGDETDTFLMQCASLVQPKTENKK